MINARLPRCLSALFAALALGVGAPSSALAASTAVPGPVADPAAPACQTGTAPPANDAEGSPVVVDDFESGGLQQWSVDTGGDGRVDVRSLPKLVGDVNCAARLRTTSEPGSLANITAAVPPDTGLVSADGWFNLTGSGGAANPYFRFFSGSTRIAQVYRVTDNGQYWLQVRDGNGTYRHTRLTSRAVSMNAWHHIQVSLLPDGPDTAIEVWLDGVRVFSSTGIDGPSGPITSVMIGNEHPGWPGEVFVDDVIIKAAPRSQDPPCTPPPPPTNAMPGSLLLADGFECGDLSQWTVRRTGDGEATVGQGPAHGGDHAAVMQVSDESPSMANLSRQMPAGTSAVSADGWFEVTEPGPDGNDVPYFRFFDGSRRVADVYRYNSTGQLWLRITSPDGSHRYTRLTTYSVDLDTWHRLQVRVVADGDTSVIKVWLDGVSVYASDSLALNTTAITSVMLGSEHYPQARTQSIDDVILRSGT